MRSNSIIIVMVAIAIILFFVSKKVAPVVTSKLTKYTKKVINEQAIKQAFANLKGTFKKEVLQNAERIYRLETAHFTTGNFAITGGAGFEATKEIFPFGWTSLKQFWLSNTKYLPTHYMVQNENKQKDIAGSGIAKKFIVFPSIEAGIASVAYVLTLRNNDMGAYFANDEKARAQYRAKLNKIVSRYV